MKWFSKKSTTNSSQNTKEFLHEDLQNIRVHTMQDDINALQNNTSAITFLSEKTDSIHSEIVSPFSKPVISQSIDQTITPIIPKKINSEKIPFTKLNQNVESPVSIESLKAPHSPETTFAKSVAPLPAPPSQNQVTASTIKKISPINSTSEIENSIILKEGLGWKKPLLALVVVLLFGGGGFFLWKMQPSTVPNTPVPVPVIPITPPTPKPEVPKKEYPFSTDKPNTFLIDIEASETVSTLREKLIANGKKMQEAGMKTAVPFSVVDKTNTPIAFFIFVSIFNLGLSNDFLNSLDNTFTLYIFDDERGGLRLGFSVAIKDTVKANEILSSREETFPTSFKNLFLTENTVPTRTPLFQDSSHRNIPIRFFNFVPEEPWLSIDYTIVNNVFILGTSRATNRAIMDIILDTKK